MDKIGLFPLGIVIFPESTLPLHIFEPRYKQLITQAINEEQPFGINLVEAAQLYPTGCTVEVAEVFRQYPDGRMDIAITGRKRYMLQTLYEGEAPYYTGVVDFFDDNPEEINTALRTSVMEMYNETVRLVYPHSHSDFLIDEATYGNVSFFMAQKSGLDILKKQQLLESRSENERLETLRAILEELLPDLRLKQKLQQIVMNDGYLKPMREK